jgi:hypothetical protein
MTATWSYISKLCCADKGDHVTEECDPIICGVEQSHLRHVLSRLFCNGHPLSCLIPASVFGYKIQERKNVGIICYSKIYSVTKICSMFLI